MTTPDLQDAASAIELAAGVIRKATLQLAETSSVDADQVLAYDLAHAAAAVETARSMLDYGAKGELEGQLTCIFVADAVADLGAKLWGRETQWNAAPGALDDARSFVSAWRDPAVLSALAFKDGPRHLDQEFELAQDTFRRFGAEVIAPQAEHIHRHNTDIPEEIISGLADMGVFGLSIPEEYGGFATGGEADYYGMV
ncbi:MAG: acyl-CoA dehydrogenase family protein, partial [Actinomycetota bacterium]|nr:acyl-CoA dehydrogenase family protein [Actinomycetota bacterium]